MADLMERVLGRTSPTRQASRGQPYNYPALWYGRPDGAIVKLAGDPQNRAYYEDKGYAVLRPEEAREWEEEVRPLVLEAQHKKAAVIATIRRIGARHPGVEIVDNLDDLEIDDLEEFLVELGKVTNAPVRVMSKKFGIAPERPERDPEAGAPVSSGAELAEKMARSARATNVRA